MKILELLDPVSTFQNGMQTLTTSIVRTGQIENTGIKLEYLDSLGEQIFVTCEIDGKKSHIVLNADKRLPFGDTRKTMQDDGMDFLFQNCDSVRIGEWKYSADLSDDENNTKYEIKNEFFAGYIEIPLRDGISPQQLHSKFILYFPTQGKTKDVDGMAILEVGSNLFTSSGLVHYYNFRFILETDVNYL